MNSMRIKADPVNQSGWSWDMKKKKRNLTTKEGGRRRQVEINVLEHDMSEKKKGGGDLMVGGQLWGEHLCCSWSVAHSI